MHENVIHKSKVIIITKFTMRKISLMYEQRLDYHSKFCGKILVELKMFIKEVILHILNVNFHSFIILWLQFMIEK